MTEKGFFDRLSAVGALPIDPVLAIMVVAFIIFVLSFTGCLGALRENICLLKFFSVCLGIIFFAEVIAGILGFVYKDWFQNQFGVFVNKTITGYREDPDLQNIIDFSQTFLECCGGNNGIDDWENNVYFNCSSKIEINERWFTPAESCGVPFSCCRVSSQAVDVIDTHCGYGIRVEGTPQSEQTEKVFMLGCVTKFEDWLKTNLYTVAGVFIGIALVQIVPICMAQNMISDIEAIKSRWRQ